MTDLLTGYDSSFDEDDSEEESQENRKKRKSIDKSLENPLPSKKSRESKEECETKLLSEERRIQYYHLTGLDAYARHKKLINDYVLCYAGGIRNVQRDRRRDKTDWDVIRENHQFVWNDDDEIATWEQQLAKKYYDKLFKEYCLADLGRYKENKVGLRWRTEKEVVQGKGQFICGNKVCTEDAMLRSWEVNFAYMEQSQRKNTLIKLRLCPACSRKLNFHHKYKELPPPLRPKHKSKTSVISENKDENTSSNTTESADEIGTNPAPATPAEETSLWLQPKKNTEERSNAEEFEEYFQDLLL